MLDKKVLKDIQSLSLKKHRQETGLFVAEGPKLVGELLLTMPQQLVALYATKDWAKQNASAAAQVITEIELERISQLQTPNEVVALFNQMKYEEPEINNGWCIYLDTIQDPGNLGTIIRIADWFGIENIVCSAGCAELYNPKLVQATMGSIARVAVWNDAAGTWLQKQIIPVLAAVLNGTSIQQLDAIASGILLIGNESKGIGEEALRFATQKITIPKMGAAESLNAAVAAGIILSHLRK